LETMTIDFTTIAAGAEGAAVGKTDELPSAGQCTSQDTFTANPEGQPLRVTRRGGGLVTLRHRSHPPRLADRRSAWT
jgi:hypothetical protein